MAQKKSNDLFAEIGMERNTKTASGYRPEPLVSTPRMLPDGEAAPFPTDDNGLNEFEELEAHLDSLRQNLTPYLRELASPLPVVRKELRLERLDFQHDNGEKQNLHTLIQSRDGWESMTIPHYGGPIGRAKAYYRYSWEAAEFHPEKGERLFVSFGAVDYHATVYLNGHCVGQHIGSFAPFEFDVTDLLLLGRNTFLVQVENDAIIHGNFPYENLGFPGAAQSIGSRLYASTGLGWNDPSGGWVNCPPGMGICQPVTLQIRPLVSISNVFARPLTQENAVELRIELYSASSTYIERDSIECLIEPRNFSEGSVYRIKVPVAEPLGHGHQTISLKVAMPDYTKWSPQRPAMYSATVSIISGEQIEDSYRVHFGMRDFQMETETKPLGRFYLNNEEIRLRGANNMGSFMQRAFKGEWDGLIEDVLLAKAANMNFVRFTQMPRQPEVYDACSRLGLMTQTDLPLFGELNRNTWNEAIKQAGEMERLVRNYPCNIVNSFINERGLEGLHQPLRHLNRTELDTFYQAASDSVRLENPDRVIKENDGDYAPPPPGYPDYHAYSGWYNGNGIDLFELHKGYWQNSVPENWRYGCGEFGAEGLDRKELAIEHYPEEWLPEGEAWSPNQILGAQTGKIQNLWFERPKTWEKWIQKSREHQKLVTKLMTQAFRRDTRMNSIAIHLFIDAFPATWMKSMVDFERVPKPAYFAYRQALQPISIQWRCDRFSCRGGEPLYPEIWFCNDTQESIPNANIHYSLEIEGKTVWSFVHQRALPAFDSICLGALNRPLPEVHSRQTATLRLQLVHDELKRSIAKDEIEIELHPRPSQKRHSVQIIGSVEGRARKLSEALDLSISDDVDNTSIVLIDDLGALEASGTDLKSIIKAGKSALILGLSPGTHAIFGTTVQLEPTGYDPRHFCSRDTSHPFVHDFQEDDFRFWYDDSVGYITPFVPGAIIAPEWETVLSAAAGPNQTLVQRDWEPAACVVTKKFERGSTTICPIDLARYVKSNPVAYDFAIKVLQSATLNQESLLVSQ